MGKKEKNIKNLDANRKRIDKILKVAAVVAGIGGAATAGGVVATNIYKANLEKQGQDLVNTVNENMIKAAVNEIKRNAPQNENTEAKALYDSLLQASKETKAKQEESKANAEEYFSSKKVEDVVKGINETNEQMAETEVAEEVTETETQEIETEEVEDLFVVEVKPVVVQTSSSQEVVNDKPAIVTIISALYKDEKENNYVAVTQDTYSENGQESKSIILDSQGNAVEGLVLLTDDKKISTSEISQQEISEIISDTKKGDYIVETTFDEKGNAISVNAMPTHESNEETTDITNLIVTPTTEEPGKFLFKPASQKEADELVANVIEQNIDKLPEEVQTVVNDTENTVIAVREYSPVAFSISGDVMTNFKGLWLAGIGPRIDFIDRTTGETKASIQVTGAFNMTNGYELFGGIKAEGAVKISDNFAARLGVGVQRQNDNYNVFVAAGATIQIGANNSSISVNPNTNVPFMGVVPKGNPGPSPSPTPKQDPYQNTIDNTGTDISEGVNIPGSGSKITPEEKEDGHETGFVDPYETVNPTNPTQNDMPIGTNSHIDLSSNNISTQPTNTQPTNTQNQSNSDSIYGNAANQQGQKIDIGLDSHLFGI